MPKKSRTVQPKKKPVVTIDSLCGDMKASLIREQDFEGAARVRAVGQALADIATRELNRKQAVIVTWFLCFITTPDW